MADRPVLPEIEITPEMMEAGAIAFSGYDPNFDNSESIACEIFYEMFGVSPMGHACRHQRVVE